MYEYEHEFVFAGDFSPDGLASYAGSADPADVNAAVQAAIAKMKTVMKHVACPVMSIRAETANGANVFKVTLSRA